MKIGKRILLVAPQGNMPYYVIPLGLGFLKSNLPDCHEVEILDSSIEETPGDSMKFKERVRLFRPDVIGVTTTVSTYEDAIKCIKSAKSVDPSIVTVLGGPYVSLNDEDVFEEEELDFVIRGEGEISFSKFIDALFGDRDFSSVAGLTYRCDGKVKKTPTVNEDMDSFNIPDYQFIQLGRYLENSYNYGGYYGASAPIWFTRGCPYGCKFCSAYLMNGKAVRAHSTSYMLDWIEHLYVNFDVRQFSLVDDGFTTYPRTVKEFCQAVIDARRSGRFKERIYFAAPNGFRMERLDDEMLRLMKEAGWEGVTVAPESGSRSVLKLMRKNLNPDIVPDAIDRIKAAGLMVRAFFMLGYPGETKEDVEDTIKLIRKCDFDDVSIGTFVPFQGTPIYNELVESGELKPGHSKSGPMGGFSWVLPGLMQDDGNTYRSESSKELNFTYIIIRERLLVFLRKPAAMVHFFKYYGFVRLLKVLTFAFDGARQRSS